jgi:hypothetical protein
VKPTIKVTLAQSITADLLVKNDSVTKVENLKIENDIKEKVEA